MTRWEKLEIIHAIGVSLIISVVLYIMVRPVAESFENASKVKKITELVKDDGNVVIVKIHAKWCGFCKKLQPIWRDVKRDLNRKRINGKKFIFIDIEDVEKDELKQLKKSFGFKLEFFPSILKISKKNGVEQFNGKTIKSKITNWILKT